MADFPRIEKYDENLRIFFQIWKRVAENYIDFITKLYTLIVVVVESFFAKRKFLKFCCCFTTKRKQNVMELFFIFYTLVKRITLLTPPVGPWQAYTSGADFFCARVGLLASW